MTDLDAARRWYEAVFELGAPDVEPAEGVVEYELGTVWLQLGEEEDGRRGGTVLRVGVLDVHAQRSRLVAMGVEVGEVEVVEGVVAFFDFEDPYGNPLSFYSVTSET